MWWWVRFFFFGPSEERPGPSSSGASFAWGSLRGLGAYNADMLYGPQAFTTWKARDENIVELMACYKTPNFDTDRFWQTWFCNKKSPTKTGLKIPDVSCFLRENRVLPEDHCKEDPCSFPWCGELARSWPKVGQLLTNSVYKILLGRFLTVFPTKSAYKIQPARSWQRVGHGLQTFDTNIYVLKLQGSFLQ